MAIINTIGLGGGGGEKYGTVDFLLVGRGGYGGNGWSGNTPSYPGGGGGGGGVLEICGHIIQCSSYNVEVHFACENSYCCDSCFNGYVAKGGGWGSHGGASNCQSGGNSNGYVISGVTYCTYTGGYSDRCDQYSAGGGAGAGGNGCNKSGDCGGNGGEGISNNFFFEQRYFSAGGAGGGGINNGIGGCACSGGGNGGDCCCQGCDATECGAGGGGSGAYGEPITVVGGNRVGSYGGGGLVGIRYKTKGSGIKLATGGCKYTCGEYTFHCFTANDTFCVIYS